jgi:hypothetical protein
MATTRIVLNDRNIDRLPTLPEATSDGPFGRVWSYDEANDEARAQRLIRNLDAGR